MYFFLPFSFLFPFLPPPPRPFRTRFFFLPFRPPILSKPRFLLDGYIGVRGRRCACSARRCQTRGKIRLGGGSIMTSASMVSDGWWNLVAGLLAFRDISLCSLSPAFPPLLNVPSILFESGTRVYSEGTRGMETNRPRV